MREPHSLLDFKMIKVVNFIHYMTHSHTVIGLPFGLEDNSNTLLKSMYHEIQNRYGNEEYAKAIMGTLFNFQEAHDRNLEICRKEYESDSVTSRICISPVFMHEGKKVQTLHIATVSPLSDCKAVQSMRVGILTLSEDLNKWKEIGLLDALQCADSAKSDGRQLFRHGPNDQTKVPKTSPLVQKF